MYLLFTYVLKTLLFKNIGCCPLESYIVDLFIYYTYLFTYCLKRRWFKDIVLANPLKCVHMYVFILAPTPVLAVRSRQMYVFMYSKVFNT